MGLARKSLKFAFGSAIGLSVLCCGGTGLVGVFLPGEVALSAEEVVAAPPDRLFDPLDDAEGIARWWAVALADQGEAGMAVAAVPGSPVAGVGTQVAFTAGGVEMERWTILELVPPKKAVYEVDFKLMKVTRTITLVPEGLGTRLTWSERGTIGNPWMRFLSLGGGHEDVIQRFHRAMAALGKAGAEPQ